MNSSRWTEGRHKLFPYQVGFVAPPADFESSATDFLRIAPPSVGVIQHQLHVPEYRRSLAERASNFHLLEHAAECLCAAGAEVIGQAGTNWVHCMGTGVTEIRAHCDYLADKYGSPYFIGGLSIVDALRGLGVERVAVNGGYARRDWKSGYRCFLTNAGFDVVTAIDPELVALLGKNEEVDVIQASGGAAMTLSMWVDTPPFDDLRVRQALKAVVDRQGIVDGALLGIGEPGADNPIPPSSKFAFTTQAPKRDIAKAKRLLAEAGYPDGIEVELHVAPAAAGYMNIAQAYVQMAAEAGIKVRLKQVPAATYWSETWLKVPFMHSSWSPRPPSQALSVAYRKEAKWNETHWYRDDYDALLDRADATLDDAERLELWKEAQKLLAEEGGAIITAFYPAVAAVRSNCSGYAPHPARYYFEFLDVACSR